MRLSYWNFCNLPSFDHVGCLAFDFASKRTLFAHIVRLGKYKDSHTTKIIQYVGEIPAIQLYVQNDSTYRKGIFGGRSNPIIPPS